MINSNTQTRGTYRDTNVTEINDERYDDRTLLLPLDNRGNCSSCHYNKLLREKDELIDALSRQLAKRDSAIWRNRRK